MSSKCVETIDRLPHEGKDIVRSSGKPGIRVHHRDRHGFGHHSEPSPRNRRGRNYHRCGHVRRAEELIPPAGTRGTQRGFGSNILEAPIPIAEAI